MRLTFWVGRERRGVGFGSGVGQNDCRKGEVAD